MATTEQLLQKAREQGWVIRQRGPSFLVSRPGGDPFWVKGTPGNAIAEDVWLRTLSEHGLEAAEDELERLSQDAAEDATISDMGIARKAQQAAAQAAKEEQREQARLDREATEAEAVKQHLAAGGLVMDPRDILKPHSVPTRYPMVRLTPAMCDALLDHNTSNRPVSRRRLDMLRAQMHATGWLYTGDMIRFDTGAVMLDGQHRLLAAVEEYWPLVVDILCGLPPETFHVIDTGRSRTAADGLAMMGEANRFHLASVIRIVGKYLNPTTTRADWSSSRGLLPNLEVARIIGAEDDTAGRFRRSVHYGQRAFQAVRLNKSAAAAFWYLSTTAHGEDHPRLESFLDRVCDGMDLSHGNPVLALRRFMLQTGRRGAAEQLAVIIKAWNAYGAGKSVSVLTWRADESMPDIVTYPRD